MPAAIREIERLRSQVKSLQAYQTQKALPPPESSPGPTPTSRLSHEQRKTSGVRIQVNSVYYGPSSLQFFLHRFSSFLDNAPNQATCAPTLASIGTAALLQSVDHGNARLPLHQEEYFMDFFWHSYHLYCPIICETEFRAEYRASWANPTADGYRATSSLADIILALCIQFSASFMYIAESSDTRAPLEQRDPVLAGLPYFRRCQMLLDNSLESPSLGMVQSYVFCIIYLTNAGRLNAAQIVAHKAVTMATILGLNGQPSARESESHRRTQLQTWRSLCMLEAELSIELGRPENALCSCLSRSSTPELLEGPNSQSPQLSQGNNYAGPLSLQDHTLALVELVQDIHRDFCSKCDSIDSPVGSAEFYENGEKREECAAYLREQIRQLDDWVRRLPTDHKIPRRSGDPFSTDLSPLEFGRGDSVYLQSQRLLLELRYHHHATKLYRSFICLSASPEISTPTSNNNAISCLSHAVRLTNIIHQEISNGNILNGWKQVFLWQRDALFTILGFGFTHPLSPYTTKTRQASKLALEVIEMLKTTNGAAAQVLEAGKSLETSLEVIINGFRDGLSGHLTTAPAKPDPCNDATLSDKSTERGLFPEHACDQDENTCPPQVLLDSSEFDAFLSLETDNFSIPEFWESMMVSS